MRNTICITKPIIALYIGSDNELTSGTEYVISLTTESNIEKFAIYVETYHGNQFTYKDIESFYNDWEILGE